MPVKAWWLDANRFPARPDAYRTEHGYLVVHVADLVDAPGPLGHTYDRVELGEPAWVRRQIEHMAGSGTD
jgi:hypothetical protein